MHRGLRSAVALAVVTASLTLSVAAMGSAQTVNPRAADLAAARHQWVAAQTLNGGAQQAVPLVLVVADLRRAIAAGARRTTYSQIIDTVVRFGRLPDAMLTPAQDAAFDSDFAAIDRFFGFTTSPWRPSCLSHGAQARAAARAWSHEPRGTHAAIAPSWLVAAAGDLTRGLRSDSGDRACYPAAIADLDNLQSATAAEVSAAPTLTARSFQDPGAAQIVEAEIAWLNDWLSFANNDLGGISVLTATRRPPVPALRRAGTAGR